MRERAYITSKFFPKIKDKKIQRSSESVRFLRVAVHYDTMMKSVYDKRRGRSIYSKFCLEYNSWNTNGSSAFLCASLSRLFVF